MSNTKRSDIFDNIKREFHSETVVEQIDTIKPKSSESILHNMQHDNDPKSAVLDKIGEVPKEIVSGAQVLVATYVRPEKTKGGLILTDKYRDEDKFQGKCGVVVAMGPLAFQETDKLKFGGFKVSVGDWVWYRPMDGAALSCNGVHCRSVDDVDIRGKIPHPDYIF